MINPRCPKYKVIKRQLEQVRGGSEEPKIGAQDNGLVYEGGGKWRDEETGKVYETDSKERIKRRGFFADIYHNLFCID